MTGRRPRASGADDDGPLQIAAEATDAELDNHLAEIVSAYRADQRESGAQHEPEPEVMWGLLREVTDVEVVLEMRVDGDPRSKGRPRVTRGRTYTPQVTVNAEKIIAWQARRHLPRGWKLDREQQFGVLGVFFTKSFQRQDVDNMLKLVLDGLTGIVWVDDDQVSEVAGRVVRNDDHPRTYIRVYRTGSSSRPFLTCEVCGRTIKTYRSWSNRRFCTQECAKVGMAPERRRGAKVKTKRCPQCGKEFPARADQIMCSRECKSAAGRVTLQCQVCGMAFSKPKSWARTTAYCSRSCQIRDTEARTVKAPKGTCTDCGRPVSRREYERCQSCALKHRVATESARPGYQEGAKNREEQ